MFPSVQAAFRAFNAAFEGTIPFMYLDVKGMVTVGVGNLIDSVEEAQALPFCFKNAPGMEAAGSPATADQIAEEWRTLKNNPNLAVEGHLACEPITKLELSDAAIERLILDRLTRNENILRGRTWFQDFDRWPADAQLGLLSMAWAMGPGGPCEFPRFRAACRAQDFKTAASECRMNEAGNPGLAPRNKANFTLFSNAGVVAGGETGGFRRAVLYYPRDLSGSTSSAELTSVSDPRPARVG
jgi:GH24 family phage-related lysozyme (muramidase)